MRPLVEVSNNYEFNRLLCRYFARKDRFRQITGSLQKLRNQSIGYEYMSQINDMFSRTSNDLLIKLLTDPS